MAEAPTPQTRDFTAPILWLWQAGLRFGGAIDVGCAEGYFSLALAELGPLRGAAILNVDAQEEFRAPLAAIHEAIGGHYRICAVGARDGGTIELYRGAHPYWSSVREPGDRYWAAHNSLCEAESVRVPLRTIDALVRETRLPGPYLLKLDVQGAERDALLGARRTLEDTAVVLAETLVEEFAGVHALLAGAGFELFDLAQLHYVESGVLGWFHPIYLHARYRDLRPVALWDPALNELALDLQRARHARIEENIARSLARLRAGEWPPVPT
ncbi:MAG: FkbM family methyltransferase [Burkholderiales bacterium]|nr:FkbM family methyltransferase [Burkholderiales bacterium]